MTYNRDNISTLPAKNSENLHPKLLVIVGPTATGKSALAIELAERFNGELLCADSRTVYRGMDIGTAKPTAADRHRVPHWGLDLVDPDQTFTAADFKAYSLATIRDIVARAKLPIMVGGSGLYIDSVVYDYQFRQPGDQVLRAKLENIETVELQNRVLEAGLDLPENMNNRRYLIRAIEAGGVSGETDRQGGLRPNTLMIGVDMDIAEIEGRIEERVWHMLDAGLAQEVRRLAGQYGWEIPAMQAPAYKAFRGCIEGKESLEAAIQAFVKNDRALAKRQKTWFKRNKSIHWLTTDDKLAEAVDIATTFLNT